jgi:hypothetical protein
MEVDVFQVAPRHSRVLLILAAVATVGLSACGNGTGTASPGATATDAGSTDTSQPSASVQPSDSAASLDGANAALSAVTSYKFTMTVVGGDLSDNTLSQLPNAPADGKFSISGTYVVKPEAAADITVANTLHDIAVGGNDYQDVADQGGKLTGSFTESPSATDGSALPDQLSPTSIYTSFDFSGSFTTVGPETKNGVAATHFQAGDSALAEFAAVAGVQAGAWTADVWLATSGGYPVSISIVGTTSATDKKVVYERSFDLKDVNSTANIVTAPTNVTGA